MLQATRRTGEQGLLRIQRTQQLHRSLNHHHAAASHRLAAFIAPALLAGASSASPPPSLSYSRQAARKAGPYRLQQVRLQSTDTQRESRDASQLPPSLASSRKAEKDKSTPTSSSQTTSTTHDRDGIAIEKGSSSEEKEASKKSTTASASEKVSTSKSSSTSSSSTTVTKSKEPLLTRVWAKVKHEASHYWSGTKLLGKEIKISARLQMKLLRGKVLTRREKRQLKRTTQDLLRLIPFIPFVLIPFMEFLLPVALKLFPNMLPSTFEDKHAADEKKRKLLKVRLEMAKFLQETIRESGLADSPEKIKQSQEFKEFFRKVRSTGEEPDTDDIVKVAKLFEDDLTLDNLSRPQLVSMCRYMNINAFGTDNFLRYTIRKRLDQLSRDDKLIDSEGVDALSTAELSHACISRGIRTGGIDDERLRAELAQWIDLHLHHRLSGVLLILSKAFAFTEKPDGTIDHLSSLKHTLSSLPDNLLNETEESVTAEHAFKQRLEVLQQQEELIEDEAEQEQEEEEARKARKQAELEERERLAEQAKLAAEAKATLAAEDELAKERSKFVDERERAQSLLPDDLAEQTTPPPPLETEDKPSAKDAKMTPEQLGQLGDALFILSAKSSVVRERQDLAKLMEESQQVESSAESTQEGAEGAAIPEPRKVTALEKSIQKMITKIDQQLEAYDQEVSDKMNKFECSNGRISVSDLRTAFEQIRHRPDDETITALIDKLDVDHDGFVPLEDVTSLAEVEGLGVVVDDAADTLIGQGVEMRHKEGLRESPVVDAAQTPVQPEIIKDEPKKPKREEIVDG